MKYEGFWYSTSEPDLHMPIHSDMIYPLRDKILAAFDAIELGSLNELNRTYFKGLSICRCCQQINGSIQYEMRGWSWPQGYRHYVEVHNIVPSTEFMEEALGMSFD